MRFPHLFYCADDGRPAKPIRLMCGLLILRHMRTCPTNWLADNGARMLIAGTFAVCWSSRFPIPAMQANRFTSASVSAKRGMELILACCQAMKSLISIPQVSFILEQCWLTALGERFRMSAVSLFFIPIFIR